jgi:glycosyltransferase involved in cell wall biosynthesis
MSAETMPAPAAMTPAATIVIPLLRQRDEWLRQALASALDQTEPAEVVVVTSQATPASNLAVLDDLTRSESGTRAGTRRLVVTPRTGSGFANAINTGISRATTSRVGFLLSDDWLDPDAVTATLAVDADIVSTGARRFTEDGTPIPHMRRALSPDEYARRESLERRASYLTHFFLFRKRCLEDAGGLDESLGDAPGIDDYDLIWTLLERGATVGLTDRPYYNVRIHAGDRLTMRPREEQLQTLEWELIVIDNVGDAARDTWWRRRRPGFPCGSSSNRRPARTARSIAAARPPPARSSCSQMTM